MRSLFSLGAVCAADRDEFVLITYMVVVFSILIQGLTIGKLAKKLLKPVTV
jgi:CPA1 family monovalent cation:H+ antiporter